MTGGFIWYELMTADPDAAAAFYGPVTGWAISESADPQAANSDSGGMDYRHIARADGGSAGGVLRLSGDMLAHGARPAWVGYVHVADVDAACGAIISDGGRVLMPKMALPVGEMAMVTDPQGAAFYVMTPVPPPGQPDAKSDVFDPAKAGHVRWNELMSDEPAAALAFYGRHFGWSVGGAMDMGPLGTYTFVEHEGTGIGAIMPRMPGVPVSCWTFYIGVANIDAAMAAVKAGGGQVLKGPDQIPGGEFSANCVDPQGAAFGIVGPRNEG